MITVDGNGDTRDDAECAGDDDDNNDDDSIIIIDNIKVLTTTIDTIQGKKETSGVQRKKNSILKNI